MDLVSYANNNLGQHLDNGQGSYAGECVSLAIRVAHDVYNVPFGTLFCSNTGGARDLFEQFDGTIPQYFDKIPNDPMDANQLPEAGDLIIWGSALGSFGHIGVVMSGQPLTVFQQLGTPIFKESEIHTFPSYSGVLGWLRPKVAEVPVEVPAPVVEVPVVVPEPTPVVETPVIAPESVIVPVVEDISVTPVAVAPTPEAVIGTTSASPTLLDTVLSVIKWLIKTIIGEKNVT